jgi:hypothetical protein
MPMKPEQGVATDPFDGMIIVPDDRSRQVWLQLRSHGFARTGILTSMNLRIDNASVTAFA